VGISVTGCSPQHPRRITPDGHVESSAKGTLFKTSADSSLRSGWSLRMRLIAGACRGSVRLDASHTSRSRHLALSHYEQLTLESTTRQGESCKMKQNELSENRSYIRVSRFFRVFVTLLFYHGCLLSSSQPKGHHFNCLSVVIKAALTKIVCTQIPRILNVA